MIISKNVKIKINSVNYKFFKKCVNDIKKGEEYVIDVFNLPVGSHTNILVECDICHKQSFKPYRQYLLSYNNNNVYCCSPTCAQFKNIKTNNERYGRDNVFQIDEIKNKIISTNNKKYGVDYPSQSKDIRLKIVESNINNFGFDNAAKSYIVKEKMKNTCREKYGVDHYSQSTKYEESLVLNGRKVPDFYKSDFEIYQFKVRKITRTLKSVIFYDWNGYDYYDNEYIKENLNLNPGHSLYPTIDHKTSIFYGFMNNISIDDIAHFDNLCITKRTINSSKNRMCEYEYIINKNNNSI